MATITFVPAYGRQYPTIKEAMYDWDLGKDFRVYPGGYYLSKRDVESAKTQYETGKLMLPNLGVSLQIWWKYG
jgi:hypothetical protein